MALVFCESCGHHVSSTAPRCPGCGGPGPAADAGTQTRTSSSGSHLKFCEGCGASSYSAAAQHCTRCGAALTSGDTKPCPFCGETILAGAQKCRFCGEFLDASSKFSPRPRPNPRQPPQAGNVRSASDIPGGKLYPAGELKESGTVTALSVVGKVSPTALILTLFCFLLPFVTFSCGPAAITFSGIEMVTGTTVQVPQPSSPPVSQRVDPEGWAVVAFLAAIAGLGLGFSKAKKSLLVSSAASAGFSVLSLVCLKSKLESDVLRQGGGAIKVNWQVGYYLTVIFLLIAVGASVYSTLDRTLKRENSA